MSLSARTSCLGLLLFGLAGACDAGGAEPTLAPRLAPVDVDGWARYVAAPTWERADSDDLVGGTTSAEAAVMGFFAAWLRDDPDAGRRHVLASGPGAYPFIDIVLADYTRWHIGAFRLDARRLTPEGADVRVALRRQRDGVAEHFVGVVEVVEVRGDWLVRRPPSRPE